MEDEKVTESGGVVTEAPPITEAEFEQQTAEMEKQQLEQLEQDQKLLDALDNVLAKSQTETVRTKKPPKIKFLAGTAIERGAGFLSLGFILVFMGIVALISLSSANYLLLLRLVPVCLIIIGLDLIIHLPGTRGKIRVNIPCMTIAALIVTGVCVMSVALNKTYTKQEVQYNNRSIAAELYEQSYRELNTIADIETLDITVNLNPDGKGKYKGELSADDYVTVQVRLSGVYNSPNAFARECKKIIDGYKSMNVSVTDFGFANDSQFNSYRLEIEGKFAQDFTLSQLEERVNYIYTESNEFALTDLEEYDDEQSQEN